MNRAEVIDIKDKGKTFHVKDANGNVYEYEQGEGFEEHPTPPDILHLDMMGWGNTVVKGRFFEHEGASLPDIILVRDGSNPGYHKYHRRRLVSGEG